MFVILQWGRGVEKGFRLEVLYPSAMAVIQRQDNLIFTLFYGQNNLRSQEVPSKLTLLPNWNEVIRSDIF